VIAVAAIVMMCWSWGTWPDVILDFGREIYTPWRLASGDLLYRDVAYFNGPLSPYWNSLWFRLVGVSLRVLALTNFALVGVLLALLYALISRIGSRASACLACLTFVLVFGFSRYTVAGNYNYICPYSHEMTHGMLLSLAALLLLSQYVRRRRLADAALCGLCVGLVFLTKPEIFLAVAPATGLGMLLALWSLPRSMPQALQVGGAFLGSVLVPPVLSIALLSLALPAADAVGGTLGGFRWVLASEITSLPFYRQTMGTLDASYNLQESLKMLLWYGLLLGIPAAVGLLKWRTRGPRLVAAAVCFGAVMGFLLWHFSDMQATEVLRPAPAFLVLTLAAVITMWFREPDDSVRARWVPAIACVLFALLLLAKIFLWVRVTHYGFCLAMPAAMLLIVAAWDWLPRVIEHFDGSGAMLRAAFLAALLVVAAWCLMFTAANFGTLTVPVGSGGDAVWADARGKIVNWLIQQVDREVTPEGTIAVAPEGCLLNYLTRRANSTPYVALVPVEVLMFGEERIVESFERQPPEFLVLTDEEMNDYGFVGFGIGYAENLFQWFKLNYRIIAGPAGEMKGAHALLMKRIDLLKDADDKE
jgi:hypothetical protein